MTTSLNQTGKQANKTEGRTTSRPTLLRRQSSMRQQPKASSRFGPRALLLGVALGVAMAMNLSIHTDPASTQAAILTQEKELVYNRIVRAKCGREYRFGAGPASIRTLAKKVILMTHLVTFELSTGISDFEFQRESAKIEKIFQQLSWGQNESHAIVIDIMAKRPGDSESTATEKLQAIQQWRGGSREALVPEVLKNAILTAPEYVSDTKEALRMLGAILRQIPVVELLVKQLEEYKSKLSSVAFTKDQLVTLHTRLTKSSSSTGAQIMSLSDALYQIEYTCGKICIDLEDGSPHTCEYFSSILAGLNERVRKVVPMFCGELMVNDHEVLERATDIAANALATLQEIKLALPIMQILMLRPLPALVATQTSQLGSTFNYDVARTLYQNIQECPMWIQNTFLGMRP